MKITINRLFFSAAGVVLLLLVVWVFLPLGGNEELIFEETLLMKKDENNRMVDIAKRGQSSADVVSESLLTIERHSAVIEEDVAVEIDSVTAKDTAKDDSNAFIFLVEGKQYPQKKTLHVYEKILRVYLADLGDQSIGAIELVLSWNSEFMYPVDQVAVCDDRSGSVIFQQGKLIPGQVRFGLMMPTISAGGEVVSCRFNLVANSPEKVLAIAVKGSRVYAFDGAEIEADSRALKVSVQ